MPTYKYTARDQEGKSVSGKISAESEASIVAELRKRDLMILTVYEEKEFVKKAGSSRIKSGKKVKTR